MKRRAFPAVSSGERRNADLFFADLMGRHPVPADAVSETQLEADQFLADLFGEPAPARPVTPLIPIRGLLPAPRTRALSEDEELGEAGSCPTGEELKDIWTTLLELRKLVKSKREEMDSNPLVIEVQMITALMEVLDTAKEVPSQVWGEIWQELKVFASCDVKPLVERVKKSEKHANAVLRVLHGLTAILQGYVHDRIDDAFKSRLEAQKGWGKRVAKALIFIIKKQVPVIQRDIKAGNFEAVATAFQSLKTELSGEGVSVTGVWDVVVTLGKQIIGSAIDDALKNTARWVAKKTLKKMLGSAAKAASVLFVLEDIALFVHAMVTISDYKKKLWAYNDLMLKFLARMRSCSVGRPGDLVPAEVGWQTTVARVQCSFTLISFKAVPGGEPGEGAWKQRPVQGMVGGKTTPVVTFTVRKAGPGRRVLGFRVPPVADWPAKDNSFVAMDVATYDSADKPLITTSLFVVACVP